MSARRRHDEHRTLEALLDALADIEAAPRDAGTVELLCRRPAPGEREVLREATFDPVEGLVGDSWRSRGSRHTPDGSAHPEMQVTMMAARTIAAIAGDRGRWPLAGDQIVADLDLAADSLPAGARLAVGEAELVVSEVPHTGCGKFVERYGVDAMRFLNSEAGRRLRLRGVNLRVARGGVVRTGDAVRVIR